MEATKAYNVENQHFALAVASRVAARESRVNPRELQRVVQTMEDVISSTLVIFPNPRAKEAIFQKV